MEEQFKIHFLRACLSADRVEDPALSLRGSFSGISVSSGNLNVKIFFLYPLTISGEIVAFAFGVSYLVTLAKYRLRAHEKRH